MTRLVLAAVAVSLLAQDASAGPLRNLFTAVRARVEEVQARRVEVRQQRTEARLVRTGFVAPVVSETRVFDRPTVEGFAPAVTSSVVPVGYHAHQTANGRVIVHSDANHGSASAHAGVTYPWPKIAFAGQPVPRSYQPAAGSCPNGRCPR